MSAPKNLFPGGSYVTTYPGTKVHQVISGPQRYNTEKSCWEYDPTYNSKVTFENSLGVNFTGPPRDQITQQTFTPENMNKHLNWSIQEKDKEIAELKRHNLDLVEELQTKDAQINQLQTQCCALQTCTESLDKDEHEIPPSKVIVDGVEWHRLRLRVKRLDEDFGARLKLLENAHTSLVSSIRRCVETINDVEF